MIGVIVIISGAYPEIWIRGVKASLPSLPLPSLPSSSSSSSCSFI